MDDNSLQKKEEAYFTNQEKQISLYFAVKRMICSIGPVKIEVMKSQISFGTKTKFAFVWLPQPWPKKRPENSIILTFGVGRHIENEQIVQAIEPYPGRWTHHVIIQDESDLNAQVYQWLTEAYFFFSKQGK